jgi:TRAP-type C4-dicarboxylate transport system permease large subunit
MGQDVEMMAMSAGGQARAAWHERAAHLATLVLLGLVLVIGTGEMLHGQLLKLGESAFGDRSQQVQYFMLRADPVRPACDPQADVEAETTRRLAAAPPAATDDAVDALFAAPRADREALRRSLAGMLAQCRAAHDFQQRVQHHITPALRAFRGVEIGFFALFRFGTDNRALILLALLAVTLVPATLGHHHICLRPPRSRRDFRMQSLTMGLASALLLYSSASYWRISLAAGVPMEDERLHLLWIGLFALLTVVCFGQLLAPPPREARQDGGWLQSLQSMPMLAGMALVAGGYFVAHGHPSGAAIYMNKIMDIVGLSLALALHIWAGMLFKRSDMVDRFMNILRPWRLSPQALTWIILLAAGLPTAYAGVSSVFVMAAGAIIYREVRAVGGSGQYALAATAMSGSLGVVLRPSLLVVGIAALNKEVTTVQLFHWGAWVFALTSTLFFVASQFGRTQRVAVAAPSQALPAMLRELASTWPYVAVVAAVLLGYRVLLDTPFDEGSAPHILPIVMLAILWMEHRRRRARAPQPAAVPPDSPVRAATAETVSHIGAYIGLVAMSQIVSGMVERSEVMNHLAPDSFPSVWAAMAFLVVAKVLLGMVLEPLGAVVLVSSTLAPLAYRSGIDPVHFWMMVLVAFELGYLLPPVALNQLLARQVVGEAEIEAAEREVAHLGWWRRHERWLLPLAVMSVALLIVAFVPLAFPSLLSLSGAP